MQTITRTTFKLALALMLVMGMFGMSRQPSTAYAACAPTVSFDLYARVQNNVNIYGSTTVNIWGYSDSSIGAATLPGPALGKDADATGPVILADAPIVQGDCVQVTLHNVDIPEATSLVFQGQSLVPDTAGVTMGNSVPYIFTASNPGTFLYEAGLTANAPHQVAMGMYGALIVRPTAIPPLGFSGQAYASTDTAFNTEAVMVLSEFDTSLAANPTGFDMRNFKARYSLINGKAYPGNTSFPVAGSDTILLRYINAGVQAHAMTTLGLTQTIIAQDGSPYTYSHKMVAETISTGQTLDTLVTIPALAAAGSQFAVYDANMLLKNNSGTGATNSGMGGMLTFLTVPGASGGTGGPVTTAVALSPNPSNGSSAVTLTATITSATTVTAAEYFVDVVGADGTGCNITGSLTSVNVSIPVSGAAAPCADLMTLTSGNHTFYVHGTDGTWGAAASAVLNLDKVGPATSALSLVPNPTNGTANVTLIGTASDSATGNHNIAAAEYFIDSLPVNGLGTALTVNNTSVPTAGLAATISAATVNALSEGNHTISVHSQDALGNWGMSVTITLKVDKTAPTTSGLSANPNPNNGSTPYNTSVPAVRVFATFSDTVSNIATGEGFLDTVGAIGTGFVFIPTDGSFNSLSETAYADIPLAVVGTLSTGAHPICVHAKDAAGNWGVTTTCFNLTIDKTPPTVTSINRIGANPAAAGSVQWQVTFSESVTGVTSANFATIRTGLGGTSTITSVVGGGATWTVTATTGTGSGTIGLNLTSPTNIKDLAGNAMTSAGLPFVGQVFTILPPPQPNLYFSTAGNTNPSGVGGTADDADIYFYNGSAFSRNIDVTAITTPLPTGANVDGFDRADATHFYMSFSGDVTIALPGPDLTVQDEDVVYYNAGTWSVYFDGTALGLGGTTGGTSFDLDAISIVGGTLYFSTDNNNTPTGAGGTGDDADIYRWNGGSSYTRMVDASVVGWSTANVDGLVWVDATHVYLSYSTDTTAPGSLAVQDEDVVRNNGGTWSVYFDGTAVGLTSGDLDIDAFDLP